MSLLLVACLLTPTDALSYSARVRWAPSTSGDIAEYEVYKRPMAGSYGTSEPGLPTADSGGVLTLVVANLDVRTDYAFRVKAVATTGASTLSNEVQIGYADVASLLDSDGDGLTEAQEDLNLNRLVDEGESNPDLTDSDGDGVGDLADTCEGTVTGVAVSTVGCSCAQVTCNNEDACDGAETCSAGTCRAGTPPLCDDGNACTTDSCDPASGCRSTPIAGCSSCTSASQCNDTNPCTTDTCGNGMCQHVAVVNGTACNDANVCNGAETCQSGTCRTGSPLVCSDDGNRCTLESCDATAGCVRRSAADGAACGDGNACNGAETCRAGACQAGVALHCADTNACTADSCNPATGCVHTSVADGTACGIDRGYCAGTDSCRSGVCTTGGPPNCDDANTCTIDACDSALGRCTHQSRAGCCRTDTDCADSDACTTGERCASGVCVSNALFCPDPGQCATSRCDAVKGCTTMPLPEGTVCNDGNACSTNDRCASGRCAAGTSVSCPDPGSCAAGRCDALLGCVSDPLPDGTACNDGNKCTKRDACSSGVCGAGSSSAAPLMTVQRFTVRDGRGTEQRLRGRAKLPGGTAMDLDRAGITLQIDDAVGAELYRADLPATAFLPEARPAGTHVSMRPGADPRLRRLAIDISGEDVKIRFSIVGDGLIPLQSNAVTLRVKGGDGCGRARALTCRTVRGGVTCAASRSTSPRERLQPGVGEDGVIEGFTPADDDPDTGENR